MSPRATVLAAFALAFFFAGAFPAAAQWTQVAEVPATDIFSVWANGDTIAAGTDSVVYVSTDAGATWSGSAPVAAGVTSVQGVVVHNGRLYAGTYGQGVFVSDDLGATWLAYSQGLSGGIFNTHLFTTDLMVHGGHLYLATGGAGVYRRNLAAGNWSHYGEQFEPNQSSNLNDIAAGGSRLFACGGFNGNVFFRDLNDPDWTQSWLDNNGAVPGLAGLSSIWTGSGWVVGSNVGVFTSPAAEEPWTFVDVGLGTLFAVSFATRGNIVFAAFGVGVQTTIAFSRDNGATWEVMETLFPAFIYNMGMSGTDLYAGRGDGLWRRSIETVSVPRAPDPARLRFAIQGPQPVRDEVRFRFELPEASDVAIELFDVAGRKAERLVGAWPGGAHEVALGTGGLTPGVYLARLTAGSRSEVVRLIRVR